MPSEESLKRAREICAPSYSGGTRVDDTQHILDVATALDAAKAERTEECAKYLESEGQKSLADEVRELP